MKPSVTFVALLLWIGAGPAPGVESTAGTPVAAPAYGLHRCVGANGVIIFTDRQCVDIDAVESTQQMAPIQPGALVRVRSCARNQDDLLFGVRSALENRDVNRLADYYHWTGMGTAEGYRVMGRLSKLSERPLVDVRLASSAEPDDADQEGYAWPDTELSAADANGFNMDNDAVAPPPPPRAADLLRVDQMRSGEDVAAHVTYFHLRSNAGCWWLQF